jgi:Uma2 family endonuclease
MPPDRRLKMAVAQTQMTLEEFLQLPEEKPALEFEHGMVSQKVSPTQKHSTLEVAFAARVNAIAAPTETAYAFIELRTTFGGRSYVPDVAVLRWDHIQFDDDGMVSDDIVTEPPAVAVEVVSPGQSVAFLIRKCVWYSENGVRVAVLVDPKDRSVILFRPGPSLTVLRGEDSIALDDVLAGFQMTVNDLFDSMRLR